MHEALKAMELALYEVQAEIVKAQTMLDHQRQRANSHNSFDVDFQEAAFIQQMHYSAKLEGLKKAQGIFSAYYFQAQEAEILYTIGG
jgi:hypothetical protein